MNGQGGRSKENSGKKDDEWKRGRRRKTVGKGGNGTLME